MKKEAAEEAAEEVSELCLVVEYALACECCGKYEHRFQRVSLDQRYRVFAHSYDGSVWAPIGDVTCERCRAEMTLDQITVSVEGEIGGSV